MPSSPDGRKSTPNEHNPEPINPPPEPFPEPINLPTFPTDLPTDITTDTPADDPTDIINTVTTSSSSTISHTTPIDAPTIPTELPPPAQVVNSATTTGTSSSPTTQSFTRAANASQHSSLTLTQTSFSTVISTTSSPPSTLTQLSISTYIATSPTSASTNPSHALAIVVPLTAVLVITLCVFGFVLFRRRRRRQLEMTDSHQARLEGNKNERVEPFPIDALPLNPANPTTISSQHPDQPQLSVTMESFSGKNLALFKIGPATESDLISSDSSPVSPYSPVDTGINTTTVGERLEALERLIKHHVSDESAARNARPNLSALRSDLYTEETDSLIPLEPPPNYSLNRDEQ